MQTIGALQPGLPSTAIPKDTCKVILDLNDHFYAIPLAPQDCQRFASGSPSVNLKEPKKRYQRSVLPQSMANSVMLGKKFVTQAIHFVGDQFTQVYVVHSMDDILPVHKNEGALLETYKLLQQSLTHAGLLVVQGHKCKRHPTFI